MEVNSKDLIDRRELADIGKRKRRISSVGSWEREWAGKDL